MAAILGRVSLDGKPIDEKVFRRAFDALRPGRSVRSDLLVETRAAFGYHDPGLNTPARQPVRVGPLTIVADAVVHERDDLARTLGLIAREHCDAGLILHAYARWGADCLAHLHGDFAFAIHDGAGSEVFLARDHIGTRPLYWTQRGGEVLFATLLHGLTALGDCRWQLDEARIARFLCDPDEIRLESFVEGVEIVAPGHWVRVRGGDLTRRRWWNPFALPGEQSIPDRDAPDALIELTERAVRARLPSTATVGAHLSGGVDSSLVTGLASGALKSGGGLVAAYAWSPPVSEAYPDMGAGDERRRIGAQCRKLGLTERYGSASAETYEALIAQPMELQGTANLMDELPVIAQAGRDGVAVMLSGWGGDEVLSSQGLGHLAWLLRRGRFGSVLRVARRRAGGFRRPHRVAGAMWRAAVVPMLPGPLYRRFSPYELHTAHAFPSADIERLDQTLDRNPPLRVVADADAFTRLLLLHGHLGERMATWAAWAAPAGVEYRYPLTDRRLLEFILSMSRDVRFGDGTGRYLVRRAFAPVLPRGATKNDPVNENRRHDNRLAWLAGLAVDADRGRFDAECPWLNMPALRDAIRREAPRGRHACVRAFAPIFAAVRMYEMHSRQSASEAR